MDISKCSEFPAFAGLWRTCISLVLALRHWVTESGYKYLLALLFTLGYGLLDEWHQTFVAGRFGTLTDVGFDVMGAVIGLLIYRTWFTVEKKKIG